MATTTPTPSGWYVDPTGKHEHRYWDGAVWTATVSDAGVTTTDEPGTPAPQGAPAHGYRGVAVPTWRVAALYAVTASALGAFAFEMISSASLRARPSDASRWAWLYREAPGILRYGYPPLGLWIGLILTAALTSALLLPPLQTLKKAGCHARWRWDAPAERQRLTDGLRTLGYGRTLLRGRGGHLLVVLSELAALTVVGVSGYAVVAQQGILRESGTATGKTVGDLSVGLGPKVCLVVGVVSAVLTLVAWPWGQERHVLVLRDGSVIAEPPT
ncbi:MAG: DUF2510 domain-containing protein [Mycobacteriales bacterium]